MSNICVLLGSDSGPSFFSLMQGDGEGGGIFFSFEPRDCHCRAGLWSPLIYRCGTAAGTQSCKDVKECKLLKGKAEEMGVSAAAVRKAFFMLIFL